MSTRRTPTRKAAPHEANPTEVETFAHGLSEAFLLCRELGHNWKPWTAAIADGGYERVLRCPRCRTERHQLLDSRGHPVSGHYVYADGYQHKGLGRIVGEGREMLRLESVLRTVSKTAMRTAS